jgi:MFS family permease
VVVLPPLYAIAALAAWGGGMGDAAVRLGVLGMMAVFYAAVGAIIGVWSDWFAHLFDARVRGTVTGVIWAAMAAAMVLGGGLATGLLRAGASDRSYAALFLVAAVACTIAIALYGFLRDPAAHGEEREHPHGRALLNRMRLSLREPRVRALLVARVLGNAAFAAMPFLALRYTAPGGGGLGPSVVVASGVGFNVCAAVGGLIFGRIGDRFGHRHGLIASFVLVAVGLVAALAGSGLTACVSAYLTMGLGFGAWNTAGYLVHETTPHDSRLAHLIACNTVAGAFGLVVPLGWALLANQVGSGALLVGCIATALAGLAWSLFAVPEPRESVAPPRLAA